MNRNDNQATSAMDTQPPPDILG